MATFHTTKTGTMNVQVRIGGDMALIRGVAKAVLEAAEKDPYGARPRVHRVPHARVRGIPRSRRRHRVGRHSRRQSGHCRSEDSQACRYLHRRQSASSSPGVSASRSTSTASTRCARSSTCFSCAATSDARERDRARSAGTATCRATAPAASITVPTRRFLTASARSAASTRRASTGLGTVDDDRGDAPRRGEGLRRARRQLRALPRPTLAYTAEALRNCELTVQVSTKLNRSHIVHGKRALILPCLGRTEKDRQTKRRARDNRRGLDVDGAHLTRDERARVSAPAVRVRDPGRHGAGDAAQQQDAVAGLRR